MSQMIESFMNQGGQTAHAQAIAFGELGGSEAPAAALLESTNPLHGVKVKLQVCVGEAVMTVAELLGARQNEVLALDRAVDAPVDLLLDGKVVARGELVAVEGSFGVRITELPLPLKF